MKKTKFMRGGPDDRTFIRTRYGRFWPLDPRTEEVDVRDIAYGAAGEYRYSGHSRLTLAQHCVVGSYYCREPLAFLFHDGSETLGLRDIASPVKHAPQFAPYCHAERTLMKCIFEAFNIDVPYNCAAVKETDRAMYVTESFIIWKRAIKDGETSLPLTDDQARLWLPDEAERRFLARYAELTGGVADFKIHAALHSVVGREIEFVNDPDARTTVFGVNSAVMAARLAATPAVPPRPPNSFTQAEYAMENGVGETTARRAIQRLAESGKIRPVRFKIVQGNGHCPTVGGWQLVEGK